MLYRATDHRTANSISMNTGQTLLSIGALVLLGTTIVTINRSSLSHGVILQQTEIGVYAVSLAMGVIEEASGKALDTYTAPDSDGNTDVATSTDQLTAPALLGKESGETYPNFDDFDDYNYFNSNPRSVYVPGVDTMHIRCSVNYVQLSDPDVAVSSRTWHKKMTVYVMGTMTQDTVKVSTIFSYWWFR